MITAGAARAWTALLLAAALAFTLAPLPLGASELTDEERAEAAGEDEGIQLADDRLVGPEDASRWGFWLWPEGRRGYFLTVDPTRNPNHTEGTFDELIAVDLDTGEEVGRGPMSPGAWITRLDGHWGAAGGDHAIAVDRDGGRLFVPYGIPWRPPVHDSSTIEKARPVITDPDTLLARVAAGDGRVCVNQPTGTNMDDSRCVGGVHVVDAATLETTATIPLSAPLVVDDPGNGGFMPMLRAVRHTPPRDGEAGAGKVHLVVEDYQHHLGDPLGGWSTRRSFQQFSVHWAIQLDVATGSQDWAVRLDACRGARDSGSSSGTVNSQPFPAAVFRGPHTGDLYVGCSAGSAQQAVVVRVPLDEAGRPEAPVAVGDPAAAAGHLIEGGPGSVGPDDVARRGARQQNWVGPDGGIEFHADPVSGRMVIRANPRFGEMWWVFDEVEQAFIGAVGIGDDYRFDDVQGGLDEAAGRLYVLANKVTEPDDSGSVKRSPVPGGLFVADIRHTPLPQAVHYPRLAPPQRTGTMANMADTISLVIDPAGPDRPRRIFYRLPPAGLSVRHQPVFQILADVESVPAAPESRSFDGLTLDLDEVEGVTGRSFDGAARGYGARVIMVGGLGGVPRAGPVDPGTAVSHWDDPSAESGAGLVGGDGLAEPCVYANRELVLAFSGPDGPAVVDGGGSRGGVQPVLADATTGQDAQAPVSRCSPQEWEELWSGMLFSQAPAEEPGAWPFDRDSRSECVSGADEGTGEQWSDPYLGRFHGQVRCEGDEAGGRTGAGGLRLDDPGMPDLDAVSVTEAVSNFRVYLDPERGLVARVESVARGVKIGDVVSIDTVRGTAESWANGRANKSGPHDPDLERDLGLTGPDDGDAEPVDGGSGEGADADEDADDSGAAFNPFNCDTTRTAGTCFERHFFGVSIGDGRGGTAYQCGPCGDEAALVDAIDAALGTNGAARLRDPDPGYARGADNGYLAGIVKPDSERFADMILNNDGLQTVVPSLEVIRYAPANSFYITAGNILDGAYLAPQARQIVQLAGIEVSSTYSIQCLLEYDPVTNVCADSLPDPASLRVELIDLDGAPLAGGAFELRRDTDGDGVLGLVDELVEGGACATGSEGVCSFTGLEPGSYLVSQTAAPEGYAPVDEPLAVSLFGGDDLTVTFTNVPNVSTISLTVTDLDGTPVEGAVFGVFPDADYVVSASTSAGGVEPVATCTTDADGVCAVTVPPGAYVLRQLSAPDGLLPIDDIAFVISQAGQTADVALTLGTAGTDPVQVSEPAAGPVDDFGPVPGPAPLAQPAVSIAPAPARPAPSVVSATPPPPAIAEQVGGTIIRVIRSPANALRLAARSPVEGASLVMVLLLVGLAVMAVIRRQQLATLLAVTTAPGGGHGSGTGPPTGRGGPGSGAPRGGGTGSSGPGGWSGAGGSDASGGGAGGPGGGPSPTQPDPGPHRPATAASAAAAPTAAAGSTVHAATAVLERPAARGGVSRPPVVAGAAPAPGEALRVAVVVASAHPALAALVTIKLAESEGCEVLAVVDSFDELRVALADAALDVLVLDLGLPTDEFEDACALLASVHPPERTVGLIPPHLEPRALAVRGQRVGIAGLLAADEDLGNGHLAYAVRKVAAGKRCYGPAVQTVLADESPAKPPAEAAKGTALSSRELQVARLAASGMRRSDIAERLHVSHETVKSHLRVIRSKLGVTDPRDPAELRRALQAIGGLGDTNAPDISWGDPDDDHPGPGPDPDATS